MCWVGLWYLTRRINGGTDWSKFRKRISWLHPWIFTEIVPSFLNCSKLNQEPTIALWWCLTEESYHNPEIDSSVGKIWLLKTKEHSSWISHNRSITFEFFITESETRFPDRQAGFWLKNQIAILKLIDCIENLTFKEIKIHGKYQREGDRRKVIE